MSAPLINRRAFVGGVAATLSPALLSACGGGGGGEELAAEVPTDASNAAPPPPPEIRPQITALQVSATAGGSFPYSATLMPLRGQVPAGAALVSDDDNSMAHSVFTTWDDGSAAIVVVSGNTTVTDGQVKTLKVQIDTTPTDTRTALTTADISRLVQSVTVDCGAQGAATRTDFSVPDRVWWTNSQVICARYRARVGNHKSLEAVIDIHAYASGRAFVEVVLENCHMNTATPTWPGVGTYSASFVQVNDQRIIENVSAAAAIEGQHTQFRAWYASGWVGGATGLRVTQLHTDLQKHPLLFKVARESTADMAGYAADRYVPWATGRQRAREMGSTGDHPSIGPIPQWEARFLQTGDARAANAVEVSSLAVLTYTVNYRDSNTGWVPGFVEIGARDQQGNSPAWLRMTHPENKGTWESAHHPASGLMAFIARPAPVFVEIAQKIAVWNGTWSGANNDFTWTSGTHGYWYQMRGRAWCLRSLVHATFLTPNDMGWRTGGLTAISNNTKLFNMWRTDPRAKLNTMWDYLPRQGLQDGAPNSGFQTSLWGYHFLLPELHKAASARLLSGDDQQLLADVADWACTQPVRWINEQPNGGWRYIPYQTTMGRNASTIDSADTWGEQMDWYYTNTPPSIAGAWYVFDGSPPTAYSNTGENARAGAYYPSYLWAALAAAVERELPGAREAWATVQSQVTTLSTWLDGFGTDPRWAATPRNL